MGLMSRPFAALYERIEASAERAWIAEARRELLIALEGIVLEIGAGTGLNFQHYPPGVSVVAIDPNPHMLKRASVKAASAPVPVELRQADAMDLPFPDGAFDGVVATLTLCSIPKPRRALAQVLRVAKPGAPFLLIEHVQAKAPLARLLLNVWSPAQQFLGDGCHPNRDTEETIRRSGFEVDDVTEIAREFHIVPYVRVRARTPVV